jgi:DNA-binding XRE family transcriptional regulator
VARALHGDDDFSLTAHELLSSETAERFQATGPGSETVQARTGSSWPDDRTPLWLVEAVLPSVVSLRAYFFRHILICMKAGRKLATDELIRRGELLAQDLRALREKKGLSRETLGLQAQVSPTAIEKIELRETIDPGFFTVADLVRALEADITRLAHKSRRRR